MAKKIYKILRATEWQHATMNTAYAGSADDIRDGFIHFSTSAQLPGTLDKHYRGENRVCIAAFKAEQFSGDTLRWEPSRGGDLFPHLYDTLNVQIAVGNWSADIPKKGPIELSMVAGADA